MNADKIKRLRTLAAVMRGDDYAYAASRVSEAADELERLGKIEAAEKRWRLRRGSWRSTRSLVIAIEANQRPIGGPPE